MSGAPVNEVRPAWGRSGAEKKMGQACEPTSLPTPPSPFSFLFISDRQSLAYFFFATLHTNPFSLRLICMQIRHPMQMRQVGGGGGDEEEG